MAEKKLRTAEYSQEARNRLAAAVTQAREAIGHDFRPGFAKEAGLSLRSLADIETGKPTVGEANLKRVARALPTWNEDTPRVILEGGPIPPNPARTPDTPPAPRADDELTFTVTEKDRQRWRTMTTAQIIEEGEMIGRTISERMQEQYLRAARAVLADALGHERD